MKLKQIDQDNPVTRGSTTLVRITSEDQIKEQANKAFEWLIKYCEDYANQTEADNPTIRYSQGLASGLRHAAKMANIQLEYFNTITKTYKDELPKIV